MSNSKKKTKKASKSEKGRTSQKGNAKKKQKPPTPPPKDESSESSPDSSDSSSEACQPVKKSGSDKNTTNRSSGKGLQKKSGSAKKQESDNSKQRLPGLAHASTGELEACRKRLYALDTKCRAKIEEQTKKFDKLEEEQTNKVRTSNADELDKKLKAKEEEFQTRMEQRTADITAKQKEELARLKEEVADAAGGCDKKRADFEKEIEARQSDAQADIDAYTAKRKTELLEQIKRAKEQCEADIKHFTEKRLETNQQLIEQIKMKLDLELKNDKQKGQLKANAKMDKVKERYHKMQNEEIGGLKEALTKALAELREQHEADISQKLASIKAKVQKDRDKTRTRIEDEFREERTKLQETISELEDELKGKLKFEQRELELRKKMKQELLKMMAMPDTIKIADEDFIVTRHRYKIVRNQIVVQSNSSTVYAATKDGAELYCKVTMFNKWSVRHRADFPKHATRLMHYLTANRDRAPYFMKVLDVLATDTKLYTFMEPLATNVSLLGWLASKAKSSMGGTKASDHAVLCTGITKEEFANVLSQVAKAVIFLSNCFVAHANLTLENVILLTSGGDVTADTDMSDAKVVLTGLTRPIVYYNVEHDVLITAKGFDVSSDDLVDHLPPESLTTEQFGAQYLDVYSVGVLAYQLVRLRSPYSGMSVKKAAATKELEAVQLEPESKDSIEDIDSLAALIATLTSPKPRKRFSAEEILQQALFK